MKAKDFSAILDAASKTISGLGDEQSAKSMLQFASLVPPTEFEEFCSIPKSCLA